MHLLVCGDPVQKLYLGPGLRGRGLPVPSEALSAVKPLAKSEMTLLEVILDDLIVYLGEHVSFVFGGADASYVAMSWYFSHDLPLLLVHQSDLHVAGEYPEFPSLSDHAGLFGVLALNGQYFFIVNGIKDLDVLIVIALLQEHLVQNVGALDGREHLQPRYGLNPCHFVIAVYDRDA